MKNFAQTKLILLDLKINHRDLYKEILNVFNKIDPCNFFAIGLQEEYDIEISWILADLKTFEIDEIRQTIVRVFDEWLGYEFKNAEQLDELARKIYDVVKKYV